MTFDRYTKGVLTFIAIALMLIAVNPWLTSRPWHQILGAAPA